MEHPYITNSLNNLANLYFYQGRYEEAETFYLQSFELSKKIFGEENLDTVTSLQNLANFYLNQKILKKQK